MDVDAHREPFGVVKGKATSTSFPPMSEEIRYTKVWSLTLHSNEGQKFILGTLCFNALITSSTRLDYFESPSV